MTPRDKGKRLKMFFNLSTCGFSAFALLAFSVVTSAAAPQADVMHDGKLVSISATQAVMCFKGDKALKEHSFPVDSNSKLMLDGKPCKATDLKAGTKIRVTTKHGEGQAITQLEAIESNKQFANTHDGKLVSITSSKLVMTDSTGKEMSHAITEATKLCCDGEKCESSDLKAGMRIRVTTISTKDTGAFEIEALKNDADFVLLD
jgi:hypothetical protein